jgi:hypothetical protein
MNITNNDPDANELARQTAAASILPTLLSLLPLATAAAALERCARFLAALVNGRAKGAQTAHATLASLRPEECALCDAILGCLLGHTAADVVDVTGAVEFYVVPSATAALAAVQRTQERLSGHVYGAQEPEGAATEENTTDAHERASAAPRRAVVRAIVATIPRTERAEVLGRVAAWERDRIDRERREKEEAERRAEQERIDAEKRKIEAEKAALKAEQDRIAAEQRRLEAQKQAEERAKREAEERAEFERKAQERAKLEAERAAERAAKEKAELDAREKAEAERLLAEERAEAKRQAEARPDVKKIHDFALSLAVWIDDNRPKLKNDQASKFLDDTLDPIVEIVSTLSAYSLPKKGGKRVSAD